MTGAHYARWSVGVALLFAAMASAQERLYKWVDANGVVHYSDSPPAESERTVAEVIEVPLSTPPTTDTPIQNTRSRSDRNETPPPSANAVDTPVSARAEPQSPDCSAPSPAIASGQSLYDFEDEPPEPLTDDEIESFEAIIQALAKQWAGTDVGFACDTGARSPLNLTVEAEGRATSRAQFVLDATLSSGDSNRRELLRVEIRNERLWVNSGYAGLISVSDRALTFGYNERRAGVVWERRWRMELDGVRDMSVRRLTYTNGVLTESSTWQLRKRF